MSFFDEAVPPSADVAAAENQALLVRFTVTEAAAVRRAWHEMQLSMENVVEKYDENPDSQTESMLLVIMTGMFSDNLFRSAIGSAERLRDLLPPQ